MKQELIELTKKWEKMVSLKEETDPYKRGFQVAAWLAMRDFQTLLASVSQEQKGTT